jgi:hypothetical protein
VASDILRTRGQKNPNSQKLCVESSHTAKKSVFWYAVRKSPINGSKSSTFLLLSQFSILPFSHLPPNSQQTTIDFFGFLFRCLVLALHLYLYLALYRDLRTSSECQLERLKIQDQGCLEQKRAIEFLSFER